MIASLVFSLIAIYLVWFVSYLFTVELGRHYFRAINKIFLAAIYLALGVIALFYCEMDKSIFIYLVIGLFFTFLGDIVLMFNFTIGAGLFTIGNIFVFVFQLILLKDRNIPFSKYWYFILIVIAVMLMAGIYFKKSKKLDFKVKFPLAMGYLFFVTLHGALSLILYIILDSAFIMPFGLGSMLFMTSDYILVKYTFSKDPQMYDQRLNTTCYFMGILLIAVSMFMM